MAGEMHSPEGKRMTFHHHTGGEEHKVVSRRLSGSEWLRLSLRPEACCDSFPPPTTTKVSGQLSEVSSSDAAKDEDNVSV